MTTPASPSYAGHRFPAEIISHAVWLYFRFPLSLRMVEEMLAAHGIIVSYETLRQWVMKFVRHSPIGSAVGCRTRATGGI
jgi:putative transposase